MDETSKSITSKSATSTLESRPPLGRVALVWRGDPDAGVPEPATTRHHLIFSALAALGIAAEPVLYAEEAEDAVRAHLLTMDGVLVWVDPLSAGKDRSRLDPLLRDIASRGVWVSTHPDVILKMGVKEVLYRTRTLGWGTDTDLYLSTQDFDARFPAHLAAGGPRVLKQNRGNGGQGVWKVELVGRILAAPCPAPSPDAPVRVLHALRASVPEELALGDFMTRCHAYFERDGRILDQAFQTRLPEGMIRCYLTRDKVVGFGHQLIKALVPPPVNGNWKPRSRAHGSCIRPTRRASRSFGTRWRRSGYRRCTGCSTFQLLSLGFVGSGWRRDAHNDASPRRLHCR